MDSWTLNMKPAQLVKIDFCSSHWLDHQSSVYDVYWELSAEKKEWIAFNFTAH